MLGCEGLARIDTFVAPDGTVYVNEPNTMPGFTRSSGFPLMWQASGMTYAQIVSELIELALERPLGLRWSEPSLAGLHHWHLLDGGRQVDQGIGLRGVRGRNGHLDVASPPDGREAPAVLDLLGEPAHVVDDVTSRRWFEFGGLVHPTAQHYAGATPGRHRPVMILEVRSGNRLWQIGHRGLTSGSG